MAAPAILRLPQESTLRTLVLLTVAFALLVLPAPAGAAPPPADGLESVKMDGLREAMRGWDGLAQAWFRLKAGDPDGARKDARRLLRERPRDPDALHLLGIAAAATGHPVQARSALTRSLRSRPDGWVGVQLVNLHLDAGRLPQADKVVRELERTLAADVQVRRARAYVQIASGELEAARASLEALEQVRPTAEVAHQLAVLLAEMGDAAGALEATRRAVAREPGDGAYRRELFERLATAGEWEGLVAAGSEAGADAAGGGLAAYYRGVGLARLERTDDAIQALSQVVGHGSPDLVALVGSAGWLLQLGAYVEAERSARLALSGREGDGTLHHLLAMVLSRQDRESEGLAHYRRAAEARPDDPSFRFDLAMSLCTLGRYEELDDALQRARRDFPDDLRFVELAERCVPEPGT